MIKRLFIGLEFAVEGKRGSIAALKLENGEKAWRERCPRERCAGTPASRTTSMERRKR